MFVTIMAVKATRTAVLNCNPAHLFSNKKACWELARMRCLVTETTRLIIAYIIRDEFDFMHLI